MRQSGGPRRMRTDERLVVQPQPDAEPGAQQPAEQGATFEAVVEEPAAPSVEAPAVQPPLAVGQGGRRAAERGVPSARVAVPPAHSAVRRRAPLEAEPGAQCVATWLLPDVVLAADVGPSKPADRFDRADSAMAGRQFCCPTARTAQPMAAVFHAAPADVEAESRSAACRSPEAVSVRPRRLIVAAPLLCRRSVQAGFAVYHLLTAAVVRRECPAMEM